MNAIGPLPQTGDSQDIGNDATQSLWACKPRAWRLSNIGGPEDYGLDFQVQIAKEQQITDILRIQLKGTRSPQISADRSFISIELEATTVRYYNRIIEPILLVLCNLAAADDPTDCPLHYVWVRDELSRIRINSLPPTQKSVVLRVPLSNRLSKSTDLSDELAAQNELVRVGIELDTRIGKRKEGLRADERLTIAGGIIASVESRGVAFLDALSAPAEGHWIDPEKGSLAWHLREAVRLLGANHFSDASVQLTNAAAQLDGCTNIELAEYWSLKGKLATAIGDDADAMEYFRKAYEDWSSANHLAAWVESEVRARHGEGRNDFDDLLEKLRGQEPEVVCLRARILAVSSRFEEALESGLSITGELRYVALAIVHSIQSNYSQAVKVCEAGLALTNLPTNVKQLLMVIRARGKFIASVPNCQGVRLPPAGTTGLEPELVRDAWNCIDEAVQSLRSTGWSNNIAQVIDIWATTAVFLNRQAEVFPAISSIASTRPRVVEIQRALEFVSIQCGDFERAIVANLNLPMSDSRELRRAMHLHEAERHKECVELFCKLFESANRSDELFGPAGVLACISAFKLARPEHETWAAYLRSLDLLQPEVALLNYYITTENNLLGAEAALSQLYGRYKDLGEPFAIAATLVQKADPTSTEGAHLCIQMGHRIERETNLWQSAATSVAWALATVQDWSQLLAHCQKCRLRMDAGHRLQAFEAVALDQLGRAAEARQLLETVLTSGNRDLMALNLYQEISIRCGYYSEALSVIESMLERANSNTQRIECIRLIFGVVQNSDPSSPRLLTLARSMGTLANPQVEAQEAAYLVMFLTATISDKVTPTADDIQEFRSRANSFFSAFPNSSLIRRGSIREKKTSKDVLEELNGLLGVSASRLEFEARMERAMQQGYELLPFAMRPRLVLRAIADTAHLWEVAKRSHRDQRQYHLTMQIDPNYCAKSSSLMLSRAPALDLISLLVLFDLGLLVHAIKFFGEIAIPKVVLRELSALTGAFWGSPVREKCLQLQSVLKLNFQSILQPEVMRHSREGDEEDDDNEEVGSWKLHSEFRHLCSQSEAFYLYSDDIVFRHYCLEASADKGLCTLDLLGALESTGVLSRRQVAGAVAKLCSWRVGLLVRYEDLTAILTEDVGDTADLRTALARIGASRDLNAIMDAIWGMDQKLDELVIHGAAVLRRMTEEEEVCVFTAAGLLANWFVKAELRMDAPRDAVLLLCELVVASVSNGKLRRVVAARLWRVFSELLSLHCSFALDAATLQDAIVKLGTRFAILDSVRPGFGLRAALWLSGGLRKNSEPSQLFLRAFAFARSNLGSQHGRDSGHP